MRADGGIVVALLLGLTACAPLAAPGQAAWNGSGRYGKLSGFYDAATPRAALPPCLAGLSPEALAGRRFAQITYGHARMKRSAVAELPPGQSFALGEQVVLRPRNCARGDLSDLAGGPAVLAQ